MAGDPRFYTLLDRMKELHDSKNADYSTDDAPLSNFMGSVSFGVPAWIGALIRMGDKWSRITELAGGKKAKVKSESIIDTLMDLAVYALIVIILYEDEQHDR